MLKEFKEFAVKGNVMDLAVGVVVGGAFGKIVTSLVSDIIMPITGMLTGGIDLKYMNILLKKGHGSVQDTTLNYGAFIQNIVDFLIISFSIFLFIQLISKLKGEKKEEAASAAPKVSDEVLLLQEIRDLLKKQQNS